MKCKLCYGTGWLETSAANYSDCPDDYRYKCPVCEGTGEKPKKIKEYKEPKYSYPDPN